MTVVRAQSARMVQGVERSRLGRVMKISTARAVAAYLRLIGLIMLILLVVAWSIDLAQFMQEVRVGAAENGQSLALLLPQYMAYRTVEFVAKFFPIAVLFGVFLAEIGRRLSLESVILVASGMTLRQRIAPLLVLAVLLGAVQGTLETYLRPAAMKAHVELGYGDLARRYAPGLRGGASWFVSGDIAVRGRALRDAAPELHDALIFTGIRGVQFETVYAADRVVPGDTALEWKLIDVERWDGTTRGGLSTPVPDRTLTLDLIPEQLQYLGLPEYLWPWDALQRLSEMRNADNVAAADLAIWRRWSFWFLPGALAFLAVGLAHRGFVGRTPSYPRLIALAVCGHVTVVTIRVLWAVGKHGFIPAPVGALATAVFAFVVGLWLIRRGP